MASSEAPQLLIVIDEDSRWGTKVAISEELRRQVQAHTDSVSQQRDTVHKDGLLGTHA
ncbi:hypothetical protein [Pseudomonas sp. NPDC008258]|uniref:hypothetical protein n=1 Tax=Pseudomonas sp. NPDC008258 TaxID=3364418 RepID=UPI0036EE88BC